mgnify:FL=1
MGECEAAKARRVQLRRTKGWRMPDNTVKVDRTTKWGNPFIVSKFNTPEKAIAQFRRAIEDYPKTGLWLDFNPGSHRELSELRGKNLACWCPLDKPCHADVLLELANADDAFAALRETSPASPLSSASLRETGEGGA